ncbi:MAG: tRNA (guanosine(46)-N7)-methyltransferase TrmB [Nitrospinota bacterium]
MERIISRASWKRIDSKPEGGPPPGGSGHELELSLSRFEGPFRWEEIFGNRNPVEVEVGFGKGMFLLEAASRNPHLNYLGVELSRPRFRIALKRLERRALANVRVVRAEALYLMRTRFLPESVAAYHIYFPDPWPKSRHEKRRLFRPEAVEALARTLAPGGRLELATDVVGYFHEILALLAANPLLEEGARECFEGEAGPPDFRTHFLLKYRAEGLPIYFARFFRKEVGGSSQAGGAG